MKQPIANDHNKCHSYVLHNVSSVLLHILYVCGCIVYVMCLSFAFMLHIKLVVYMSLHLVNFVLQAKKSIFKSNRSVTCCWISSS